MAEESSTSLACLAIDCGPLKQALSGHCDGWVQRLTGLLNSLAAAELAALQEYFASSVAALQRPPTTLEQLAESVNLLGRLSEERPKTEARFLPLRWGLLRRLHCLRSARLLPPAPLRCTLAMSNPRGGSFAGSAPASTPAGCADPCLHATHRTPQGKVRAARRLRRARAGGAALCAGGAGPGLGALLRRLRGGGAAAGPRQGRLQGARQVHARGLPAGGGPGSLVTWRVHPDRSCSGPRLAQPAARF